MPSEKGCGLAPPHYPTLLTVPTSVALPTNISMDTDTKPEQLTPHSQASVTQNITVVPVQSAGLMTTGERVWDECSRVEKLVSAVGGRGEGLGLPCCTMLTSMVNSSYVVHRKKALARYTVCSGCCCTIKIHYHHVVKCVKF